MTKLAQASGIETPRRVDLARLDRTRKKKGANDDWTHPHDPDAKITKMKDGRTHLAHKAEHAVDLETGAIVAVTVQDADDGDVESSIETLIEAAEQIEMVRPDGDGLEEVVGDKAITAISRSSISKPSVSEAISRNPIGDDGTGRRTPTRATPCTAIGDAPGARAACAYCDCAASVWNGPSRISTRQAGCGVSTCVGTRTFESGC